LVAMGGLEPPTPAYRMQRLDNNYELADIAVKHIILVTTYTL